MNTDAKLCKDIEEFCSKIDIDHSVDFVRKYSMIGDSRLYGGKHCGSDAEHKGADYIVEELKNAGIKKVWKNEIPTSRYQFNDATLKIILNNGETVEEIKPAGLTSPGTVKDGITSELTYAGESKREFYHEHDVKGKIVLLKGLGMIDGSGITAQIHEACLHGAAGIILYMSEDMLDEDTIRVQALSIITEIPVVAVSINDAEKLISAVSNNDKVIANLTVDAEFLPDKGVTYNVIAEIPGSVSDKAVIFTGHLDHYFRCLQDNISSCATLLGIAKALTESGYKPKRTIRFVFHGSHECGMMDSRYPFISGSYKQTHEITPEWKGNALADINFEYTALSLPEIWPTTSVGCNTVYEKYLEYLPELTGGFGQVRRKIDTEDYYLLAWYDAISYHTAGIPAFTNDIVTNQFFRNISSPYIGRDHSNRDNWDVFSEKALEDTARFYGALGLYIDSMPCMELDFGLNHVLLEEKTDYEFLKSIFPKEAQQLRKNSSRLKELADELNKKLASYNADHISKIEVMDTDEVQRNFKKADEINTEILEIFDLLANAFNKFNAHDLLCIGHEKYTESITLLQQAAALLQNGEVKKALHDCIMNIDLCEFSYNFSKTVVEHTRMQICGPDYAAKRTWARGRECSCLLLYSLVQILKERQHEVCGDFTEEISMIETAIDEEKNHLKHVLNEENAGIEEATGKIERLIENI